MDSDLELFRNQLREIKTDPKIQLPQISKSSLSLEANKKSQIKPTILIIDDDVNIRTALKITLGKKYNLNLCSNGNDGIAQMTGEVFAVILDIKMEGKNGFETFTEIKKKNFYVPIIFYSAYQDIKDPMEIMNDFRPFGYVVKGSESNELLHTLESAVDYYLQINRNVILNQIYQKFVPKEFLDYLGKSDITEIRLGDQTQKEMSVMFSDIRDFTSLSETMSSEENFKFINAYLKRIVPQIKINNGFIDKYIGDAIMALFPNKPENAVNASIQMLEELSLYNQYRISKEERPITIGIGIHTGLLTLGIVGDIDRMESTVISDVVNLASRIEKLTRMYEAPILISELSFQKLEDPTIYQFRVVDTVKVKGKKEPVTVIEILNGNSPDVIELKLLTKRDFEFGTALYHRKEFKAAQSCFTKVIEKNPQDKAAKIYLKRSEYFAIHGISPEWEGIETINKGF
ncbi:MAG: adenylate/guanylate cyclase domain-containing protein [Spirochaetota bacterium]